MRTKIPTKDELVILLAQYKTKSKVAEVKGVDEATVRRWVKKYAIEPDDSSIMDMLRRSLAVQKPLKDLPWKKSTKETLVNQLSDFHIGNIVKDTKGKIIYNLFIAQERAELMCSKMIGLIKNHIFASSDIDEIVILLTGDMVDGEGIYEGQSYNLEVTPPKQVMVCVKTLKKYIIELSKLGLPIRIYAVKGNHGRTGKNMADASNWDLMVYMVLDLWLRDSGLKNISLEYAEGSYLNLDIKGHKYQIRHEGPNQTETAAGAAKIGGWSALYGIEALCYGHLHHWNIGEWLGTRTFMSGSLKGPDDLSDKMGKGSSPSQLIWGVTAKHVSTFSYVVDLC